ncbi:MAG TPA: potassium channel family protein [Cyclobacteriaceae bacterium]|nr:potassium channel family protein [Cyclobacteriaceae bacterium]
MRGSLLALFSLIVFTNSFAQVRLTEVFKNSFFNTGDTLIVIDNTQEILIDDLFPMFGDDLSEYLKNNIPDIPLLDGRILIDKEVLIAGIPTNQYVYWFQNFHFSKAVRIEIPNHEINSLIFIIKNSIFNSGIRINRVRGGIDIKDSFFNDYFYINTINESGGSLLIENCQFNFDANYNEFYHIPVNVILAKRRQEKVFFESSIQKFDTLKRYSNELSATDFSISAPSLNSISIKNNIFKVNAGYHSLLRIRSECKVFDFSNNELEVYLHFSGLKVSDRFVFLENKLSRLIFLSDIILPEYLNNIKINWDQFAGRRVANIQYRTTGWTAKVDDIYNELVPGDLENINSFNELIRTYQMLLNIFKYSGDIFSVNGCFSEMKDLYGLMLKHNYEKNGGFRAYFSWKINRLMKVYTDHGTDPALAIVNSIYVIFFFGLVFFIFPSEWDLSKKSKLLRDFKDFYQRKSKGYLKPFMVLLGGFLLSLLNAITLSLNSFTTLGFGDIPTKGVARYLCIVEGFIGWFLLSIFTVALINQVSI